MICKQNYWRKKQKLRGKNQEGKDIQTFIGEEKKTSYIYI